MSLHVTNVLMISIHGPAVFAEGKGSIQLRLFLGRLCICRLPRGIDKRSTNRRRRLNEDGDNVLDRCVEGGREGDKS